MSLCESPKKSTQQPGKPVGSGWRVVLQLSLPVLLVACNNGYQAPVAEQGSRQVITPPIIVDSSTPDRDLRAPRSEPQVVSSRGTINTSTSRINRASNSRARVSNNSERDSPSRNPLTHVVRSGDTLFSIAFQYDLDFRSLAIANGLNPPYTIFVDQALNLDVGRIAGNVVSSTSSNLGTPVENNSVARSQAGVSRAGGVLRSPIESSQSSEPDWSWPHRGQLLRGFQADLNEGIDIGGRVGDPVLAAGAGDVVYAGAGVQGTGNLIIVRHSDRYLSAYAHNRVMLVDEGSRVRAGEQIAEVGENSAGIPMLHFEIRLEGKSIDPATLLPRR